MAGPFSVANFGVSNKPVMVNSFADAPNGTHVQHGGQAPHVAPQAEAPQEQPLAMQKKLIDTLFAEAAKIVDRAEQKSLTKAMKKSASGLAKEMSKALKSRLERVESALRELDKLTGRQIAEYGKAGNERIQQTLMDALSAHTELADKLLEASQKAKPKQAMALQQQSLLLNRRVCTITRLIGELDKMIKAKAQDGADAPALDRTHQTARLGEIKFRASGAAGPFGEKLAAFMRGFNEHPVLTKLATGEEISPDDVAQAKSFLEHASGQLASLVAESKNNPQKKADPAAEELLVAARQIIDTAVERLKKTDLSKLAKEAARTTAKMFRMPGEETLVSVRGRGVFVTGFYNSVSELGKLYDACKKLCEVIRDEAQSLAKTQSKEGCEKFQERLGQNGDLGKALEDKLKALSRKIDDILTGIPEKGLTPAGESMKNELETLKNVVKPPVLVGRFQEMAHELARLIQDNESKATIDARLLPHVLDDPETFSAVVEADMRGLDSSMIDLDLSTKNLKSSKPIGSGVYSTAFLCTFSRADGTKETRVFKPDMEATVSLKHGVISPFGDLSEEQRAINNNVAAHEVATLLGAGHVICKSSAGYVNGRFGFLMEMAPGVESGTAMKVVRDGGGSLGDISLDELKNFGAQEKINVLAQMAQQTNQLQWCDILSGQLDRHGNNYRINVAKNGTVTLKGFDNDQSFAGEVVGVGKIRIRDDNGWSRFASHVLDHRLKDLENPTRATRDGIKEQVVSEVKAFIEKCPEESSPGTGRIIDVSKITEGRDLLLAVDGTSMKSFAPPSYMDRGIYEHIMALTDSVGSLDKYRQTLKNRGMMPEQIESAVARLMDARNIGSDLEKLGRVFTLRQLQDAQTLRDLVDKDDRMNTLLKGFENDANDANKAKLLSRVRDYGSDYFHRKPFSTLLGDLLAEVPKVERIVNPESDGGMKEVYL